MKKFLDGIRSAENPIPLNKQVINTICILLVGIALGTFSKFLDDMPANELPFFFEFLDMRNFFGRFAIWLLAALCISIYSNSSIRASINVFVFFAGMVTSYYLYSTFIAGFFPGSYAMIWAAFTGISPVLAFICWYAKGEGKLALMLSAIILAVLFNTAFVYGSGYFEMRSILELITFICAAVLLKRKTVKDTMIMLVLNVVIAFAFGFAVPFHFG